MLSEAVSDNVLSFKIIQSYCIAISLLCHSKKQHPQMCIINQSVNQQKFNVTCNATSLNRLMRQRFDMVYTKGLGGNS